MKAPNPDENGIRWYGINLGRQKQVAGRCIAEVSDHDARWARYYQCYRKQTHGEYCKQHHVPGARETWWRVSKYSTKADPVEFAGSTDAQLINTDGRRESKSNNYYEYFSTEMLALNAIASRLRMEITNHERALAEAKASLDEVTARAKCAA